MAQGQGQEGQQQDPAAGQSQAYLQAEQIKAQAKMQSDQMRMQLEMQKAVAKDDLERDRMDQDLLIKQAELMARYQAQVDVAQVKALQNQPRTLQSSEMPPTNGQPM